MSILNRVSWAIRKRFARTAIQAELVTWMAQSGVGTDRTLEKGSLPLPVHFYSPVPDLTDLQERGIWEKKSSLAGVDFRPEAQVACLLELGRKFGDECDWPATTTYDPSAFYTENASFSFGCAAALHCMIREHQPRRVIEVGSGMSSLVIAAALARNEADGGPPATYVVMDPYPSSNLGHLARSPEVIPARAEEQPFDRFEQLESGDILFIDSGHTVRIGGDVNFLILDVLPRLKPGVIVHFHDISLPYEYARVYLTNPQFRMLWTEAYLLQAFLAHNSDFEVVLALEYLMKDQLPSFRRAFVHYDPAAHKAISSSFWMARRQRLRPTGAAKAIRSH